MRGLSLFCSSEAELAWSGIATTDPEPLSATPCSRTTEAVNVVSHSLLIRKGGKTLDALTANGEVV